MRYLWLAALILASWLPVRAPAPRAVRPLAFGGSASLFFVSSNRSTAASAVAISQSVTPAIEALVRQAREDLAFLDVGRLDAETRKRYERVKLLLKQVQQALGVQDSKGAVLLDEAVRIPFEMGALALAEQAAREAAALVRRYLKVDEYLGLVEQYRSGERERAVVATADWMPARFRMLLRYLEGHAAWMGRKGTALEAASPKVFAAAVMLHTDAAFALAAPEQHLLFGHGLLKLLDDASLPAGFRKQWYLAVAAYLQGQLNVGTAVLYMDEAIARVPGDVEILIAAGALYELLASPQVDLRKPGRDWVGDRKAVQRLYDLVSARKRQGLGLAEKYYRMVLAFDPSSTEARLRLGRVLHLTGRFDAALQELGVAATSSDARARYLACMFSGAVHESAGRWSDAIAAYTLASAHCPACLSAGVAASHALRQTGERSAATQVLDTALTVDSRDLGQDPWWDYPLGSFWRCQELLDGLRRAVR